MNKCTQFHSNPMRGRSQAKQARYREQSEPFVSPRALNNAEATPARIMATLARRPGLTCDDLALRLSRNKSTILYHLRRLLRTGRIHWLKVGRAYRAFADETRAHLSPNDWAAYAMFTEPATRDLLEHLRHRPGLTQGDIARQLALTPSRLSEKATRLEHAGLIERRRVADGNRLHLTPKADAWLSSDRTIASA